MRNPASHSADYEIDDTLVEVKSGLSSVRGVRAGLLDLAYALQDASVFKRGLLVLTDTGVSPDRLAQEWALAARTLRPAVVDRLGLVLVEKDGVRGFPKDPQATIRDRLLQIVRGQTGQAGELLPRVEYAPEILKILLHEWLLGHRPMTADRLGKIAGCTYPTVARALEPLGAVLRRHPDRSFELSRFPSDAWMGLVSAADQIRHTLRFADRSGTPRSPDALLRRLARLGRSDIAVGGVIGARIFFPEFDLVGTPRVDLTMHCPQRRLDAGFVQHIDPALRLVSDREEPIALCVHVIRRKESLFTPRPPGLLHADPVECLLDLHEMHLETQAKEFLSHLIGRRGRLS